VKRHDAAWAAAAPASDRVLWCTAATALATTAASTE
jgi:hypothetical protein